MCDECETISREIRDSLAELKRRSGLTDQYRRLAVEALQGGTEEDAHRFEDLVSSPLAQECAALSSRMMRAFSLKMSHETRTGHRIPLGPRGWLHR